MVSSRILVGLLDALSHILLFLYFRATLLSSSYAPGLMLVLGSVLFIFRGDLLDMISLESKTRQFFDGVLVTLASVMMFVGIKMKLGDMLVASGRVEFLGLAGVLVYLLRDNIVRSLSGGRKS